MPSPPSAGATAPGCLLRPTNGGPAAARNDALAAVDSELVAFVDSDCLVAALRHPRPRPVFRRSGHGSGRAAHPAIAGGWERWPCRDGVQHRRSGAHCSSDTPPLGPRSTWDPMRDRSGPDAGPLRSGGRRCSFDARPVAGASTHHCESARTSTSSGGSADPAGRCGTSPASSPVTGNRSTGSSIWPAGSATGPRPVRWPDAIRAGWRPSSCDAGAAAVVVALAPGAGAWLAPSGRRVPRLALRRLANSGVPAVRVVGWQLAAPWWTLLGVARATTALAAPVVLVGMAGGGRRSRRPRHGRHRPRPSGTRRVVAASTGGRSWAVGLGLSGRRPRLRRGCLGRKRPRPDGGPHPAHGAVPVPPSTTAGEVERQGRPSDTDSGWPTPGRPTPRLPGTPPCEAARRHSQQILRSFLTPVHMGGSEWLP